MDVKQFEMLSKKLDAIIVLLAQDKLGDMSKTDAAVFLDQFGLDNSTIASIVGSTTGAVAVYISESKKAKETKNQKGVKAVEGDKVEASLT